jgi:hypothetical protein
MDVVEIVAIDRLDGIPIYAPPNGPFVVYYLDSQFTGDFINSPIPIERTIGNAAVLRDAGRCGGWYRNIGK